MYKQMYLVPPHIYSNIKKCINSVDEMSDLVESNQNIQPDYFTDVINNEKKPHAPKSDVNNSSATSALQNSTLNTTSNDVNGILPQYNLSQPGNNSLSNEKKNLYVLDVVWHIKWNIILLIILHVFVKKEIIYQQVQHLKVRRSQTLVHLYQ